MEVILNALEQGLLFALVAIGVYITYKILDFPDLSVDGTFPLGASISAAMLINGVNPFISKIANETPSGYAPHNRIHIVTTPIPIP